MSKPSEPPKQHRRSGPLRRPEFSLGALLGGSLVALGLLSQKGSEFATMQATLPGSGSGWLPLLLIIALIALNALFVAAETAISLLRPLHVRHVKESGNPKSGRLQQLLDQRTGYVAACAIGSDATRIAMVFVGFLFAPGVAVWAQSQYQIPYTFWTLMEAAILIAVPVSLVNLVVALVARSYANLHPHGVALRLGSFVRLVNWVFVGPASLATYLASIGAKGFGGRAGFAIANQAEEEIKTLVESAEESGEIERDERELLHSVFEFSDTVAREVMTPRVDLDAMPVRSKPEDVLKVVQETGHSRIPLYEETDDQIVGIIHAKDLLMGLISNPGKVNLRKLMRPAQFVPENKNLHDLLSEMRVGKSQMAIVQDEFGGTAGVVTIEDIVEELVGDIVDEYDDEEPPVVVSGDGFLVDGMTHLDDVNEVVGSSFESEEFDSIGGYVFGLFGRQPRRDEVIEEGAYRFKVAETDGRRVARLEITKVSEVPDPDAVEIFE
jgi:putative hemolysin